MRPLPRPDLDPQPGIKARYDGECARCDGPIYRNETRIVFSKGRPIHCGCAQGADDE